MLSTFAELGRAPWAERSSHRSRALADHPSSRTSCKSMWRRCGINVASMWHRCGIDVAPMWHRRGIDVASTLHQCGIDVASMWHRRCIDVASMWHRYGIDVASMWHRCGIDVGIDVADPRCIGVASTVEWLRIWTVQTCACGSTPHSVGRTGDAQAGYIVMAYVGPM